MIPADVKVKKAITNHLRFTHLWTRQKRVAKTPGRTKKTTTAVRSARTLAPSPSVRMKNDSNWPGIRPTVKSTATSGRNSPRPSVRRMRVIIRAPPPAIAPATKRCHGNRPRNVEIAFSAAATPAERAARRLNLCQPCESRPILYLSRGSCSDLEHARLVQLPDASGPAARPHGVLDGHLCAGTRPRTPRRTVRAGRARAARIRLPDTSPASRRLPLRRAD